VVDDFQPFAHLTTPNAALHRRVMGVFVQAKRRFTHGDFDWGGVRIANFLFERLPVRPWRFDAAAYREVAMAGRGTVLTGSPAVAGWDPDLAPAMTELGMKVEEESVLEPLIRDLSHS
jgi:hypothetical protein